MTDAEIRKHKLAAEKLDLIKDRAFGYMKKNLGKISEYDVNKFVISEFKKENLAIRENLGLGARSTVMSQKIMS